MSDVRYQNLRFQKFLENRIVNCKAI
jgi:hypothetical protein